MVVLHALDSVTTVRRLVAFYVQEHNQVLPHSAFRGQTLDEMYFGTGDAVPADLASAAATARRARVEANRSLVECRAATATSMVFTGRYIGEPQVTVPPLRPSCCYV